ncbi:MAG: DUF72 domain-containing protein [Candidatus Aeolococcus gillhamiae]|uniref:DUF72 domain-containing protein n=1 Tax=Candidatus Aeolococcus gillhamiae TaxID=3127015 RepID=A0A2W5ZCN0_9BACT|nr:MAG: DUF72 domain-containing protein [Candidatus Dormibacter sp. RRmetagenome_bin12]
MPLIVGTSGWQYASWRGRFYPRGLPQRAWLAHYADRFACVEVNNTFYNLPAAETFQRWGEETPADFRFVLKLSRYLTHIRRLREPEDPVRLFLERAAPLAAKTGPLLLQLPPTMRCDVARLDAALACFPERCRIAVEFRHASWYTGEVAACLRDHDAALCLTDRRGRPQQPMWRTASWGFVRLHEGRATPWPCYGDASLRRWAARIADLWSPEEEVYTFFNNDPQGCAVRDAVRFARHAARAGLRPTRVPSLDEAPVG